MIDMQPIEEPVRDASPLINRYQHGKNAYFSSPRESVMASQPLAPLLDLGLPNIADRAKESLRFAKELGHINPIVLGAISFEPNKGSRLRLATKWAKEQRGSSLSNTSSSIEQSDTTAEACVINTIPSPMHYKNAVSACLAKFTQSKLQKAVISRTLEIDLKKPLKIDELLKKLEGSNPGAYTFAVPSCEQSLNRTLIGASPELLITKRGNKISANPLAGTEPRNVNPALDKQNAQRLMSSSKDLHEHRLVIKAIEAALSPFCKSLTVPDSPSLISTPTLWHLSTKIEGELIDESTSSIDLALAMHPTPAVCGYPYKEALETIKELEGYDRHLFTGMVGWCDANGNGDWAVTIRCAEVSGNKATLYAGAGIVEGSCPEKELNETQAKFRTMLNALGIQHDA